MKKILITFIVGLLLVSSVSALNLEDFKKTYLVVEGDPRFNSDYDLDEDGIIGNADLGLLYQKMLESKNCIARTNTGIMFKRTCNFK